MAILRKRSVSECHMRCPMTLYEHWGKFIFIIYLLSLDLIWPFAKREEILNVARDVPWLYMDIILKRRVSEYLCLSWYPLTVHGHSLTQTNGRHLQRGVTCVVDDSTQCWPNAGPIFTMLARWWTNIRNAGQIVKVCIAMMLPLICLTGTPSNRTSRTGLNRVAGRRVTMDYSGLLICNPVGNPGCNTDIPGRVCQRPVRSSW